MWKQIKLIRCLLFVVVALSTIFVLNSKVAAGTGINQELAFEGKIVLTNGTNITNGTYNMEFKIYSGGTATGGGTLEWTEDYLVGGSGSVPGVPINNGTFEVNLGSQNPFASQVNWNSNSLWLSMQVGNTSSCTITTTFKSNCGGDGEMTPYISLTAVPYAFNSLELGGVTASGYGQLATNQTWTGINTFSATAGNAIALSGAPTNSATSSLLQLGNVLSNGNIATNGGTYIGLNEPSTGAGSTADFENFENNNTSEFDVNSTGAVTEANILTVQGGGANITGASTIQSSSYVSNLALINDGQTSLPPTYPSGYLPELSVISNETSSSRPLFFGYNAGSSYGAFIDAGACGGFTTMCFDFGSGSTGLTALENNGTTLDIGGGSDGNFTNVAFSNTGTTSLGTTAINGLLTLIGGLAPDVTTASGTTVNGITIDPGTNSSATGTGAALSLYGGNESGTTTATGGALTLLAGSANGASGTLTGGSVTIDAGTGLTNNGTVSVGTINATSVSIGKNSGGSGVTILAGTGGINVGSTGTSALSSTIAIANTSSGTGTQSVTIGSSANASNALVLDAGNTGKIEIGDSSAAHTLAIANGSTTAGNAQNVTIGSPTTTTASVVNLMGGNLTTTNGNSGIVIGGGYSATDTNFVGLTLDSSSTFTEPTNTCTTTVNGGTLYYNSTSDSVRACINGNWEDLVSTSGLGILAFGVIPDSANAITPGDIVGVSNFSSSPCKVTWSAAQQVNVAPCAAYSGGRKVIIPSTNISTAAIAASTFVNVCLTGTNNQPSLVGVGSTTETSAGVPTFSVNNPIVCLATVKTSATPGNVGNIWDTRTFTNTEKEFATVNSVNANGYLVIGTTTTGVTQTTATAATGPLRGVIIATAGTASSTTINAIIATQGLAAVKFLSGGTATIDNYVETTTTAGYATSVASGGAVSNYVYGGLLQNTISTSCTTANTVASACQYAPIVDFRPSR